MASTDPLTVVEYSPELQGRAAEEFVPLPKHSAIVGMLADHPVTREQAYSGASDPD